MIDEKLLLQSRPEALNDKMDMDLQNQKGGYNNGWNDCLFMFIDIIKKQPKVGEWIDEKTEIKQESNLEHYKEEIKRVGYEFALVNRKPTTCKLTSCSQCDFNDKHFTCARKRIEWMLKPYKKSVYKLNQFEYDLLNAYRNSGMRQCITNYSTLLELYEKGHIKDIDTSTPIHEILDNCEVIKDGNC